MSEVPPLLKDIPHLWMLDFNASEGNLKQYTATLSSDEIKRSQRFRFRKDYVAYVVSRGSLRYLIGAYLSVAEDKIAFKYCSNGKPELAESGNALNFNVSHSFNHGLIGISRDVPIGVDIEFIDYDEDLLTVAKNYFSEGEVKALNGLSKEEISVGFFNCWTRKEAFIKALGHGLSFPLKGFEVTLTPGVKANLVAAHFDPSEVAKWSLEDVSVPKGYAGAFAIPSKIKGFLLNTFPINLMSVGL